MPPLPALAARQVSTVAPPPRTSPADPSTISFGPVTITYDERVLTPRPWTLLQSEWAAELLDDPAAPPGPLVELCCGAGQIGLAAAVLSGRPLVQVDASPAACALARRNAASAGVAYRVAVRLADLSASLMDAIAPFPGAALVLADPPYLPTAEVGDHPEDPIDAIDGGHDGLDLVLRALVAGERAVADGGWLLLQVRGEAQAALVQSVAVPRLRLIDVRSVDPLRAVMCFAAV